MTALPQAKEHDNMEEKIKTFKDLQEEVDRTLRGKCGGCYSFYLAGGN